MRISYNDLCTLNIKMQQNNRILSMQRGISTWTCKTIQMLSAIKIITFKVNQVKTEQGICRGSCKVRKNETLLTNSVNLIIHK